MKRMEDKVRELLKELHSSFLKANKHDEGDLIFYRINYRLADKMHFSNDEANRVHQEYHRNNPRSVSQGYCDACNKITSLIPIIYGIQESDMAAMRERESEGRLIIGSTEIILQGSEVAMFGCRECRAGLPKYGTL